MPVSHMPQSPEERAPEQERPASDQEQSELDLGMISTGSPAVDAALAPLEDIGQLPVGDHAAVFEQVLADLSATMADGPHPGDERGSSTDDIDQG